MTVVKIRTKTEGEHVVLSFFAGPDSDHQAALGVLRARPDEADAIVVAMVAGAVQIDGVEIRTAPSVEAIEALPAEVAS